MPSPIPSRISRRSRSTGQSVSSVQYPPAAVTLPFTDNFNRSNGPVGAPWVDIYSMLPDTHEPMGVVSNALAMLTHRDDDYGGETVTTGWRGGIILDSGISNDISVSTTLLDTAVAGSCHGGGLVGFTMGDQDLFVGAYYNFVYGFVELGAQGKNASDFRYLDTNWCDPLSGNPVFTLRLVDNQVAVYVDGDLYCFSDVPSGLQGPSWVGVSVDATGAASPATPTIDTVTVAEDATAITDYSLPVIESAAHVGAITKFSGSATTNVPYPASVDAGQELFLFICNENNQTIATPAGWDEIYNSGLGLVSAIYHKTAVGTETGSVAVTHGAAVNAVGVMIAVTGVSAAKLHNGVSESLVFAESSITIPAEDVIGRHRLGLTWTVASQDTTHTHEDGWTTIAATSAGGVGISAKLSGREMSLDDLAVTRPFPSWPAETHTVGTSSTIIGLRLQVFPQTF